MNEAANKKLEWRLICLKCNQAKEIEWTIMVRLDEETQIKKVLAWCSNCHWFRRSVFEKVIVEY
jgi:RNase P subunit RPR2